MGAEIAFETGGARPAAALPDTTPGYRSKPARLLVLPLSLGLLGSLGLLLFYLGTITLLQDREHALTQLGEEFPFIVALTVGFGTQVGLYSYLRALAAGTRRTGVAASGGASGVAMLACCVHHLTDVLPIVGLSTVAAFIGAYKTPLLWLSLATNLVGVAYLIRQVRRAHHLQRTFERAAVRVQKCP